MLLDLPLNIANRHCDRTENQIDTAFGTQCFITSRGDDDKFTEPIKTSQGMTVDRKVLPDFFKARENSIPFFLNAAVEIFYLISVFNPMMSYNEWVA